MRILSQCKIVVFAISMSLFALHVVAQELDVAIANAEPGTTIKTAATTEASASLKSDVKPSASKPSANKKMVQDATISLQTTITGNQEQPKVLYILPWQSPQMADVDFEPLDNQHKAVFNHIERDELRRELETADAIKD